MEPIINAVASGWKRVFGRRLTNILRALSREGYKVLKDFHVSVCTRAQSTGLHNSGLYILNDQLKLYELLLK